MRQRIPNYSVRVRQTISKNIFIYLSINLYISSKYYLTVVSRELLKEAFPELSSQQKKTHTIVVDNGA